MHQLVTVDFRGDTLFAVEEPDGVFVAVKPICQRFGLAWNGQLERIKRDPILLEGMREIRIPSPGGEQETVCLALRLVNGWLFGIGVNQVKPELREHVLAYKRECYETLADRFLGPRGAAEPQIHIPAPEAIEERNLRAEEHKLALVARMQAMKGPAYAFALYEKLGLPVAAPQLPAAGDWPEADLPPAMAILVEFAVEAGTWTGTSTELLKILNDRAYRGARQVKDWPTTPRTLTNLIDESARSLRKRGVDVERRRTMHARLIEISHFSAA